jgi:hypothetical protein
MSGNAPAGRTILLECRQDGNIVVGSYSGEGVEYGSLLAVVRAMACLEGRFHHLLDGARVETGRCWATPQHTARGGVRLYFEWQMGGRDGVSIMEEVGA